MEMQGLPTKTRAQALPCSACAHSLLVRCKIQPHKQLKSLLALLPVAALHAVLRGHEARFPREHTQSCRNLLTPQKHVGVAGAPNMQTCCQRSGHAQQQSCCSERCSRNLLCHEASNMASSQQWDASPLGLCTKTLLQSWTHEGLTSQAPPPGAPTGPLCPAPPLRSCAAGCGRPPVAHRPAPRAS